MNRMVYPRTFMGLLEHIIECMPFTKDGLAQLKFLMHLAIMGKGRLSCVDTAITPLKAKTMEDV